uniref:Uncharacterized protein n=1 Tax=Candidatus Kentrum sp. SD TaxID=2126332 RepID=A0A451BRM5_9GAMM|nr:MAG: hypothetical protein BECKSD772D_GA0070982_11751 [Candidatus Kentron sp. SD]
MKILNQWALPLIESSGFIILFPLRTACGQSVNFLRNVWITSLLSTLIHPLTTGRRESMEVIPRLFQQQLLLLKINNLLLEIVVVHLLG